MSQENDVKRQAIKQAKKEKQEQQDKILSGIIDNESKTYTFNQKIHTMDGQVREGTFKAKYMGVSARLRIGTIRAKLLDGAPASSMDVLTDDLAYMIAYLTVALIELPSWFRYDDMEEISELRDMYKEVSEFMNSFRKGHDSNTNAGDSADTSGEENMEN